MRRALRIMQGVKRFLPRGLLSFSEEHAISIGHDNGADFYSWFDRLPYHQRVKERCDRSKGCKQFMGAR